ncbi:unnamed protein product [Cuscuta epithymum]|uniref:DELLA protein n=1 Tax=Cuscuta epithymum TaxID=186058 RepID=A0AAV0GEU2_9ASTE|nr:unnamed protein product [Cuscuta epithymum]CAH9146358.1 unnamed protein product [Cuscuta epithymum]
MMNRGPFSQNYFQDPFSVGGASPAAMGGCGKRSMVESEPDAGMDELLAVLGYKVRSSNMVEVAQKLEQLEEVMCGVQQDELSNFASETVHYNPSDLPSWVDSMISELNPFTMPQSEFSTVVNGFPSPAAASSQIFHDSPFDSADLAAIPGRAAYPRVETPPAAVVQPPSKRFKSASNSPSSTTTSSSNVRLGGGGGIWLNHSNESMNTPSSRPVESSRPVVLVDSQENGVRLVHTLMACAEAIQKENMKLAEALVKQIGFLAVSQAGAMRKVATYFAEALARRIYRLYPSNHNDSSLSDLLQSHFYEACPYLKFAHFTANQAILEAFADKKRVHVIDFSLKQGMQWPALLQALAVRPGGAPTFRLTGIGPPSIDNSDHLHEVGWKLAQLAETINVKFEFRGIVVNSLADLDASMLKIHDGEAVAVNSIFELHPLLARPGGLDGVLSVMKKIKPEIITVVEQEANHNGPVFMDRFTESLHYYSTFFDSLEGCFATAGEGGSVTEQDKVWSEVYLGRQICNVVACEGVDRVERHETLAQWRARFASAGLSPVHLGSNAYKQASLLLAMFAGGDGHRVEENDGGLTLGWHTRPLIATSAWKLST